MTTRWIDRTPFQFPKNDKTTLYIADDGGYRLTEIVDMAKDYFGEDVELSSLIIESENIQLRHFDYDVYDPVDWQQYLIITVSNVGMENKMVKPTEDLRHRVARAWASIDGKAELFNRCQVDPEFEDTAGYYGGYLADADALIERADIKESSDDET